MSAFLIFTNLSSYAGMAVILIGIVLTFLIEYFDSDILTLVLFVLSCIVSIFIPQVLFILPVLAYDICDTRLKIYMSVFSILPVALTVNGERLLVYFFCLLIAAAAVVMRIRTNRAERLKSEYVKQRDDFTEAALQQQYSINELLKEQDNEVKVAILDERNRIAREIHDNVGHVLSSSILQLGALITVTKDDNTKEMLGVLKDTLSDGMNSVRNSVHNLRNESIDLKEQLERVIDSYSFCKVSLHFDASENLHANLKYAVIAIVKECLTNTAKHSDATAVTVSVFEHPKLLQLVVSDNGSKKSDDKVVYGMGLENIRQRVRALQGSMNIDRERGFKLFVSFPITDG